MKRKMKTIFRRILLGTIFVASCICQAQENSDKMLVRISEIEVYPQYLEAYLREAKEVGATSVKEESGVVCIFPMQVKRDSKLIRIVEIYASMEAYRKHINTSHFQKYKKGTLHMIKSLDLVDMNALNPEYMPQIFLKMKK